MSVWGRSVRALAWVVGAVALAAGLASVASLWIYRRTWTVPLPTTRGVTDAAVIARGRYIVFGPGRCADCHVPDDHRPDLLRGQEAPLTGSEGEKTFIGTWSAPNLTPDRATGLGAVSDAQIARMLRYGVSRDGRIAPPFMDAYANLAEDDLVAIISFLRSLPPQPGMPPRAAVNFYGKLTLAYFLQPYAPSGPVVQHLEPEASVRYGEYIANSLAGCRTCHTARNLKTGAYLGPFLAGGLAFRSRLHPGQVYVSPNLTPDPATGRITGWSEDDFVRRFRLGLVIEDSPMPWGSFTRMTDVDLRALYRYFASMPPIRRDNGPILQRESGPAAGD